MIGVAIPAGNLKGGAKDLGTNELGHGERGVRGFEFRGVFCVVKIEVCER